AVLALAWSQFALAIHPECLAAPALTAHASVAATHVHCAGQEPAVEVPLCAEHCDPEQVSPDSARIPPVQPLPGVSEAPWTAAFATFDGPTGVERTRIAASPPFSLHGPTAHPAALLLI